MLCGTGSFKHADDGPADSPKPRRRRHGSNPFAARGLDKFSTVRSDLQSRRDKILRRVGSDSGLVMVRFVQCNGAWAPIVVKLPDEKQQLNDAAAAKKVLARTSASPSPSPSSTQAAASSCALPVPDPASPRDGAAKKATARGVEPARRTSFSRRRPRPPACYWLAVMVLTLLSLAVFGRAFAICCTSVAWYLVPTLSSSCPNGADVRSMEKRKVASPPTKSHLDVLCSPRSLAKRSK
jgi:hypothetical protein